jgi:SsrA-binding protein
MARGGLIAGRIAAQNRKARHNYFIEETLEAGIMLLGTEVKSLRQGQGSLNESYAQEKDGDLFLFHAFIPPYRHGNKQNHAPRRPRKLLLHKRELSRLLVSLQREGMTVVPLSIYFNDRGIAKVELGLAKGKRKYDKRASQKKRDWSREKERILRRRR